MTNRQRSETRPPFDVTPHASRQRIFKIARSTKATHHLGGFAVEIMYPGIEVGEGDSGLGTIGRIDQAHIAAGTLVPMHHHRDDEILTYLRSGRVMHKDTAGHEDIITPSRLMLMKAGSDFQHEELVDPVGGDLRALQIFLRPREAGLRSEVEFHDLDSALSPGGWRLLASPQPDAPLRVRSETWLMDGYFGGDFVHALPDLTPARHTRLLYVFSGSIKIEGLQVDEGEAVILSAESGQFITLEESDLVLIATDEASAIYRNGMFSGNRAPPEQQPKPR